VPFNGDLPASPSFTFRASRFAARFAGGGRSRSRVARPPALSATPLPPPQPRRRRRCGITRCNLDEEIDELITQNTSSTWPAPPVRSRRSARGRLARASARSCSVCLTRSRRRRSSAASTATIWRPTRSAARCMRRCSRAPSSRPIARGSRSSIRRRATSIPTGSGWSGGRRTTCASTERAPSVCIARSSASWSSATRR
jgi:hypothetical protein